MIRKYYVLTDNASNHRMVKEFYDKEEAIKNANELSAHNTVKVVVGHEIQWKKTIKK